jgi:hypothetical protein
MPIHNWSRAEVGLFHHFHQSWTVLLAEGLNGGLLPTGYFALVEPNNEVEVARTSLRARHFNQVTEAASYAAKANRVGVRNTLGELVAVIEIVSPGNKDRAHSIQAFVAKTLDFLSRGIHVLVIDLFPPSPRDPNGIHRVIWDEVRDNDYTQPADKPLTLVSYVVEPSYTAYLDPAAVGDLLLAMPIFLDQHTYVQAPLEETYMRTWEKCPKEMKEVVENPPGA